MKNLLTPFILCLVLIFSIPAHGANGQASGGKAYSIPPWFKLSFLEIQEDLKEAKAANKHVMLFMHLENCPYCSRTLDESLRQGKMKEFIQKNFDVIAINIRGDRDIAWDAKTTYTEKSLARELGIIATPTIVFLDNKGEYAYRMNGYRKPAAFKHVLNYVIEKQYKKIKLVDYIARKNESNYVLKSNPSFKSISDFSKEKGPLAVIFEDKSCVDCVEFHKEVLAHKDVIKEMKKFTLVRLDALSSKPIIDINGNKTTAKKWAGILGIDYRPGTIFFNEGKEHSRADGRQYHFHYKERLRYVSGKHYKNYARFFSYLPNRQNEILGTGVDIDFGR